MANTAFPSSLWSAEWEAEDSFADAADDTITTRCQIRDVIGLDGLERKLLDRGGVFQRPGNRDFYALGPFDVGKITTVHDLSGHGSATTGALTQTNFAKLLAHVVGNCDATQVGATVSGATSAIQFAVAGATIIDQGMIRVGALNDARGGGHFYPVNVGATTTLLAALAAQPTVGDQVYVPQIVYPMSVPADLNLTASGATSNNVVRWVFRSANLQVVARGCAATGLRLIMSMDAPMRCEIDWGVSAWSFLAGTFPSTVATADSLSVPAVNGLLWKNAKGTTTRATDLALEFSVEIGMNTMPVKGQGGENAGQTVMQWVRGDARTMVTFAVEAPAATTTPAFYTEATAAAQTAQHICYTASIVDGYAIGMYFPDCIPTVAPMQVDVGGVNAVRMTYEARTNNVTTSNLTLAPWRLALG